MQVWRQSTSRANTKNMNPVSGADEATNLQIEPLYSIKKPHSRKTI